MKFVTPEVELIKFEAMDVIATSPVEPDQGGEGSTDLPTDEWA